MNAFSKSRIKQWMPYCLGLMIVGLVLPFWGSCADKPAMPGMPQQGYMVQAQLWAVEHTVLSSEMEGKIKAFPYKEGQRFKKGTPLIYLDCTLVEAQLQKANAEKEAAQKVLAINQRLDMMDAGSLLELEMAAGKYAVAAAQVGLIKTRAAKCIVYAPFNGRVAAWQARPHQYVSTGTPLMDIINPDQLEIRLIVPSLWLSWLKTKTGFRFKIEEVNKTFPAEVTRIGATIDPVSQSVLVVAAIIQGDTGYLLPGMSGTAAFDPPQKQDKP